MGVRPWSLAYREPQIPDPTYQFKRNGSSSIDYLECGLLRDPLDYIYNSYLKIASIMYQANMDKVQDYFCNGEFGLKPKEELASSPSAQGRQGTHTERCGKTSFRQRAC